MFDEPGGDSVAEPAAEDPLDTARRALFEVVRTSRVTLTAWPIGPAPLLAALLSLRPPALRGRAP